MAFNKVILQGNIATDVELKTTTTGVPVLDIVVAVQRPYKNQNGSTIVDFVTVRAYRQTAEHIARFFIKGKPILISGSLQCDRYTDKDGNKREKWYVCATECSFCESKSNARQNTPSNANGNAPQYAPPGENDNSFVPLPDEEDLPF